MRTLSAMVAVVAVLAATPAMAAPPGGADPETPGRMRHWPRTQPWQVDEAAALAPQGGGPQPVDPQRYELPDTMTWSDYRPVPGTDWADPAVRGSERNFNGALV